jgi:uncharacterized damage-inducible protein DinB
MVLLNLLFYRVRWKLRSQGINRGKPKNRLLQFGPANWEKSMPELNATIANDLAHFYREKAAAVFALLAPLSDEQLWIRPYPYGNTIGHLLLHLTGNLNFYIGAEILRTGYVRDRPREFNDTAHYSKDHLLRNFDQAIATVEAALRAQSASDWSAAYSAKGLEQAGDRFFVFLTCASHIGHHTGQIIYLCKELERQASQASPQAR